MIGLDLTAVRACEDERVLTIYPGRDDADS